jgi:hypothetical protein
MHPIVSLVIIQKVKLQQAISRNVNQSNNIDNKNDVSQSRPHILLSLFSSSIQVVKKL